MVTILLWVVGALLAIPSAAMVLLGIFNGEVRRSQFGGDSWRASFIMLGVGLLLLWNAWRR